VNGKLEGTFQTVTPHKNFDVFVTGEKDGTVKSPSGPEVSATIRASGLPCVVLVVNHGIRRITA
jgi:hypothetical protein